VIPPLSYLAYVLSAPEATRFLRAGRLQYVCGTPRLPSRGFLRRRVIHGAEKILDNLRNDVPVSEGLEGLENPTREAWCYNNCDHELSVWGFVPSVCAGSS